jgi:hypothetical protein
MKLEKPAQICGNFHSASLRAPLTPVSIARMPSLATTNPQAEELMVPVEGLDVPPSTRPENITTLIESVDRYNPESLEVLEAYLEQQCSEGTFDCLADLAILKL